MTRACDKIRVGGSTFRVPRSPLLFSALCALCALALGASACQLLGGIGGKILVEDGDAATATDSGSAQDAGDEPPPYTGPADCKQADPAFEQAAWPVPADGPDGTNYVIDDAQGTVLDKTTHLMWQRASLPIATYDDAKCACRAFAGGSFRDWRMPTLLEMVTIVDYAKNIDQNGTGTTVAATNTVVFPDTRLEAYWTATPQGASSLMPGLPVLIDLGNGNTAEATSTGTFRGSFRCVRSTQPLPPSPRFTVQGGIVHDASTSLQWQQLVTSVTFKPSEAAGYCAQQSLRLPTVKELASLIDFTTTKGLRIDERTFPKTQSLSYVTSTRYGADPTASVWVVDFGSGDIILQVADAPYYVRCVK